jgi:NhaP-type Na+/H+ or K+/H+ antiporter
VIITTLLVQGLSLPYLIRKLKLPDYRDYLPEEEAEHVVKKGLAQSTLDYMNAHYSTQLASDGQLQRLAARWQDIHSPDAESETQADRMLIRLDILEHQRQWLLTKNRTDNNIDEEVIRRVLHLIDLEEERLKAM